MTESEVAAEVNPIPEDARKLFVGGLAQEARETEIKEYFSTFGEIDMITLKTDPQTGRSRGFAFLVFKDPSSLSAITESDDHVIMVSLFSPPYSSLVKTFLNYMYHIFRDLYF